MKEDKSNSVFPFIYQIKSSLTAFSSIRNRCKTRSSVSSQCTKTGCRQATRLSVANSLFLSNNHQGNRKSNPCLTFLSGVNIMTHPGILDNWAEPDSTFGPLSEPDTGSMTAKAAFT
jgi:hypothetical protein